ncbi:MAG TPA: hypothetical protein VH575_33090 [Gemmataceae bacterium]|jgi:hypothetical protein
MTMLDEFFRVPANSLPHPRLRNWKARLDQAGTTAALEVFRPEAVLGQSQPEMNLQFTEDGKLLPLETLPWDDDLNAGLLQLRVRAVNPEQEAERFALGLRAAMRKAEREFGDGYFNAVLVEFLKEKELTRYPAIAEVLEHAYANRPHREGKGLGRYNLCRDMISDAIGGRAHELADVLSYPQEDAKQILVAALARYLDDRFSVSIRRRLGLL